MSIVGQQVPGTIEDFVDQSGSLPLVLRPANKDTSLLGLAAAHREIIRQKVLTYGGILFRGFSESSIETFHRFMTLVSGEPLTYQERSSPRHEVGNKIYTSTDYPAGESIFLHNEQSYNNTWPLRIFFQCLIPPGSGGATPIADCRRVYGRISKQTRRRLEEHGYCYVRIFSDELGLSWRDAFQTERRDAVEEYCLANDIDFGWGSGGVLTTRQIRPVITPHPETGELTWFNHATFFNVRAMEEDVAETLLSLGLDNLPNNTYYADGAEIEAEVIEELRAAYQAEARSFAWSEGDILMLDNMLTAHGREPYTPPRKIVVGMAEPITRQ